MPFGGLNKSKKNKKKNIAKFNGKKFPNQPNFGRKPKNEKPLLPPKINPPPNPYPYPKGPIPQKKKKQTL